MFMEAAGNFGSCIFCHSLAYLSVSIGNVKYRLGSDNINRSDDPCNKLTRFWDPCQCLKPIKQENLSVPNTVAVNLF